MLAELFFVELHAPLFIITGEKGCGKNCGTRLGAHYHRGMKLFYDADAEELHVVWESRSQTVPKSSMHTWVTMVEMAACPAAAGGASPEVRHVNPAPVQAQIGGPLDVMKPAQVSTPTSHVFEGKGKGK